jgi:hypothetical protein
MIPTQPASPMLTTPTPGPSDKLVQITTALFLKPTEVAAGKAGMLSIIIIDDNIEEYIRDLQMLTDLQNKLQATCADSTDYIGCICSLQNNLEMAKKTIPILQDLITHTPTHCAIEVPHHAEYSVDRKELLNVIAQVRSKPVGENGHFCNHQDILRYIYTDLKGNAQN